MIRTIIETNALLFMMAAAGLLGALCQLLLSGRYGRLMREASDTQMEKKDFMKQLRYKFRTDRKRSNDTVSIPVFVRRHLMDYRYWRMSLHQWKRLAAGFFLISMAAAAAGLFYCFQTGMPAVHTQNILWTAVGVAAASGLVWLWADLPYKSAYLHIELEDYLTYFAASGDYQEVELDEPAKAAVKVPSIIGIRKKTASETKAQKEKRELKTNLAKFKEGARESAAGSEQERQRNRELVRQMDSQEKERIIRDVLAEFLA